MIPLMMRNYLLYVFNVQHTIKIYEQDIHGDKIGKGVDEQHIENYSILAPGGKLGEEMCNLKLTDRYGSGRFTIIRTHTHVIDHILTSVYA